MGVVNPTTDVSSRNTRDDVLVVIRSTDERTAPWCESLVAAQVPPDHVVTIREVPFQRAVVRTFELGLEFGLPWTVALDADVLLHSQAIHTLATEAERLPQKTFRLDGLLIDKVFGGPRGVGVHLYRTELLPQALRFAQTAEPVHRPEFHVVEQMTKAGYGDEDAQTVLGMHDYQQYYRDLFRKGFVHAQKHAAFIHLLEPMWQRLATEDADYQAILAGSQAGAQTGGVAWTDIRQFSQSLVDLGLSGLEEKSPHAGDQPPDVDRLISQHVAPKEFDDFVAERTRLQALAQQASPRFAALQHIRNLLGFASSRFRFQRTGKRSQ